MLQKLLRRIPTLQPEKRRIATTLITFASGPLLGICVSLAKFATPRPNWQWGWLAVVTYLLLLNAILIVNRRGMYNQKTIEGMLHTLIKQLNLIDGCDPRFCVWAPSPRGQKEMLEQVTNYLPAKKDGRGAGRKLNKSTGLVGQVFRTGLSELNSLPEETFPDQDAIIRHHMGWGFDRTESERLAPNRRAQLAVAIKGNDDEVLGVIYADCRSADGLTTEHSDLIEVFAPFFTQALLMEGE